MRVVGGGGGRWKEGSDRKRKRNGRAGGKSEIERTKEDAAGRV